VADVRERLQSGLADRYRLERELGRGGMATIYLATDLKHKRPVALKVLHPELGYAVGGDRFLKEIEVAANLSHPHILPLHDSGEIAGLLYYVMPYVAGESLRDRLTREVQLPIEEAVRITCEVADGLAYAHAQGVIHRDIKPENILLSGGHALVADFGIARAVGEAGAEQLTETGMAVGTAAYMSPEQASGERHLDGRSDVYSLGCVLYEMLAGEPPYTGPTARIIVAKRYTDPVPSVRRVRPSVPLALDRLLIKALATMAADRFSTAAEFIRALQASTTTSTVPLDSGTGRVPASISIWPRVPKTAMALGLGLLIGLGVLFTWRRSDPEALALESGIKPSTKRTWLMVSDFVGPPDDAALAAAVRELTTVELDQSRYFSTMPRHEVAAALQAAGYPDSSHISSEVARELAYRGAVRAVITGSVLPVASNTYSVILRAVSTEDGAEIASVAGSATGRDFIHSVQNLAQRLRQRLGERPSLIAANREHSHVTTPSFAAYKLYVQGIDRINAGDNEGGTRLLREAIRIDSAFAPAWDALATNYLFARKLDSARIAYSRALAFPDRLTEVQRFSVEADAAYAIRHDLAAAISWYDLVLSQKPHSTAALNNRALYLSSLGRHEEALTDLRRAIELNPFGPEQAQIEMLNYAAVLVILGRVREAQAAVHDLKGPFAQYFSVLLPAAVSDWAAAESTAAKIAELEGTPSFLRIQAVTTRAAARAARGAITDANRILRAAAERASGEEMRWYQQARLLLAVTADRPPGPLPAKLAHDSSVAGQVVRSLWAAVAGDTIAAAQGLAQVPSRPEERELLGAGPKLAHAWIDAHAGRWRAVVDSLAPVAMKGEHDATVLDRGSSFPVRWLVAQAYARLAQLDSATTFLELVVEPTRMAPGHFALRGIPYPFAHRQLALWYAALGQPDKAAKHWKSWAGSLSGPDPDVRGFLKQEPTASVSAR
jgi:serine/threonine protein kinase/tetratricopeptide (TPR) repeat protein